VVAGFDPATSANFGFAKDAMPVNNHSHGDGRVKPGHDLMYPLISPLGEPWHERIAGGYVVFEKNRACGNLAMILLFHPTASPGTAL
jgi:hypothetical protein